MAEPDRVENLRSLGGHAGAGGVVREGALFRSAFLSGLSEAARAEIDALALGLVFDLRSAREAVGQPDYVPPGADYVNVSALAELDDMAATGSPIARLDFRTIAADCAADPAMVDALEAFHLDQYPSMIRRPEAFRRLFAELLANPGRPALFHCMSGKDRTGVAAALLLTALGVSRDDVMDDYLASLKTPQALTVRITEHIESMDLPERIRAIIRSMMSVSPELLESALAEAEAECGSVEGFIRDRLGVSDESRDRLREAYLV